MKMALSNAVKDVTRADANKTKKESRFPSFFQKTVSDVYLRKNSKHDSKSDKKESKFLMMFRTSHNISFDKQLGFKNKETKQDKPKDVRYSMIFNKDIIAKQKPANGKMEDCCTINMKLERKKSVNRVGVFKSMEELRYSTCEKMAKLNKSNNESVYKLQSSLFGNMQESKPPNLLKKQKACLSSSLERHSTYHSPRTYAKNCLAEAIKSDLRARNSMTHLLKIKTSRSSNRMEKLKAMSSMTKLETCQKEVWPGGSSCKVWEPHDDPRKKVSIQMSKSSNDQNRLCDSKSKKKEDIASVSDSELLSKDTNEGKNSGKLGDKKFRSESQRKECNLGNGNRKQVQWKADVDVVYFSSHLAGDGDRTGEVLGRVVEPLREEWEQQRKGLYAKTVHFPLENPLKDRWISLLKI